MKSIGMIVVANDCGMRSQLLLVKTEIELTLMYYRQLVKVLTSLSCCIERMDIAMRRNRLEMSPNLAS